MLHIGNKGFFENFIKVLHSRLDRPPKTRYFLPQLLCVPILPHEIQAHYSVVAKCGQEPGRAFFVCKSPAKALCRAASSHLGLRVGRRSWAGANHRIPTPDPSSPQTIVTPDARGTSPAYVPSTDSTAVAQVGPGGNPFVAPAERGTHAAAGRICASRGHAQRRRAAAARKLGPLRAAGHGAGGRPSGRSRLRCSAARALHTAARAGAALSLPARRVAGLSLVRRPRQQHHAVGHQ